MGQAAKREIRRRQLEQYLATEGMTVAEWCSLNKVSESTFYKWAALFRKEEPGLFGGRDRRTSDWIECSREEIRNSAALATVPGPAVAPASPFASEKPAAMAAPPVTATVNGVTVSVPDGANESTVAAVLRAAASL